MQVLKEFQKGTFRVVLVKVPLYRYGIKKSRGEKHGYIIYTMKGENFFNNSHHSFGYRIKKFNVACRLFNEISARIKVANQNAENILLLWNSVCEVKDKDYLNKDYVCGWRDILLEIGLIKINQN